MLGCCSAPVVRQTHVAKKVLCAHPAEWGPSFHSFPTAPVRFDHANNTALRAYGRSATTAHRAMLLGFAGFMGSLGFLRATGITLPMIKTKLGFKDSDVDLDVEQ